jgi:hypothetical protein
VLITVEGGLTVEIECPRTEPARFIGQSTCTSRIGSRPNRAGMRLCTSSMILRAASFNCYQNFGIMNATVMSAILRDQERAAE